jgi:ABC-type nitrate/sulfonate/bicarbonate transport system substrate-binding protein
MTSQSPADNSNALPEVQAGFKPLTNSAPLVIAKVLDFDRAHGFSMVATRPS